MRRGRTKSLFQGQDPDKYVFDTSAWINVRSHRRSADVWVTIVDLIGHRRLFTCSQVMTELKPDEIYRQVKRYEKALLAHGVTLADQEFREVVGQITHDYPSMCKPRGEKTPADPYVVALARLEEYVVVADEGRRASKIPGACDKLKICCKTLEEFISAEMRN